MSAAPTVLVVDDDTNTRDLLKAQLSRQGCTAVEAGNGREALDYLRGGGKRPSLILLDLMMPKMTGWEFRREQQQDPALAAIPVAIITGAPGAAEQAPGVGVVDVLAKPSRVEPVAELISRFCRRR
jgi:two-component system, chemotaxis family, chemotaxis protein CheY